MRAKIGFYKGGNNWYDKVVMWWTKSPYTHAELVMPDGRTWISIRPHEDDFPTQLLKKEKTKFMKEKWDFVDLEITPEQREVILEFYEETKGCKYDWFGMIVSHLTSYKVKRKGRWYCSEWIAYALRTAGVISWKDIKLYERHDMSPGALYKICSSAEALVSL